MILKKNTINKKIKRRRWTF